MSGPESHYTVLRAEVEGDLLAFAGWVERIGTSLQKPVWAEEDPELYVVAVCLHHAYGSLESALERIARTFEGSPPPGPRWHAELLDRMGLQLDGIRPAVLSPSSRAAARELLAFWHFFRHSYGSSLNPRLLRERSLALIDASPTLQADLRGFLTALAA